MKSPRYSGDQRSAVFVTITERFINGSAGKEWIRPGVGPRRACCGFICIMEIYITFFCRWFLKVTALQSCVSWRGLTALVLSSKRAAKIRLTVNIFACCVLLVWRWHSIACYCNTVNTSHQEIMLAANVSANHRFIYVISTKCGTTHSHYILIIWPTHQEVEGVVVELWQAVKLVITFTVDNFEVISFSDSLK